MKKILEIKYENIISIENLLQAWKEFLNGKRKRKDTQEFKRNLMTNIICLYNDLMAKNYQHSAYEAFNISDPKPRNIHKASVRDRLLHHAVYRILYPYFDKKFISDSYSCRLNKGTHRAIRRFEEFGRKVSKNNTKTCWVLKCDIRKFFASINHQILIGILKENITDSDISWLLERITSSFNTKGKTNVGLPLGNLTSQLLVNIYMNEFDQWMKHRMKVRYYIRYADDFVVLGADKDYLWELVPKIADFLDEELNLLLHPDKLFVKTYSSGVDFLGWINFPRHKVLRTATKKRVVRALTESDNLNSLCSYRGLLTHGNQFKLKDNLERKIGKLLEKEGVN